MIGGPQLGATSMGHLSRTQKSHSTSEKKLKAYACEHEQEVQARTHELSEALEQQTATSQVLQVISGSPGELKPVFETMLENATRLCGAQFGTLNVCDGNVFRNAAVHNVPPAYAAMQNVPIRPHPGSAHAEVVRTKRPVQIEDARATQPYLEGVQGWWPPSISVAFAPISPCRCSRTMCCSERSPSSARRCAHSLTNRSSW